MEGKSYFSEKLSEVLFLDIKKEKLMTLFNVFLNENIYMPIKSADLISRIKNGEQLEEIPVSFFIEGMFYVLGIDEEFKYGDIYRRMISSIPNSASFIKGIILRNVKADKYEEAYIFLRGLVQIEKNEDNFDKLLSIADGIRLKDKSFKDEELSIIENAKLLEDYAAPYLYEAAIQRDAGDFDLALFCINTYIAKGGQQTAEVSEFKHSIKNVITYEKGKELLYENAEEALKLLIPLLDEYGNDATLYYHVAVGYRILENYEKAIYYLNEALAIDDALAEVINELGINYSLLGDYERAIQYLRKAFEATRAIEICTNLVMCYLNSGDIKQAKNHLDIAKKLDSNDEVVKDLDKILKTYK